LLALPANKHFAVLALLFDILFNKNKPIVANPSSKVMFVFFSFKQRLMRTQTFREVSTEFCISTIPAARSCFGPNDFLFLLSQPEGTVLHHMSKNRLSNDIASMYKGKKQSFDRSRNAGEFHGLRERCIQHRI